MADEPGAARGGLFDSLRRLGGTVVEIAEVRLELFGTEVEREKLRIGRAVLLGAIGLVFCATALLLLTVALVLMVEGPYRLGALAAAGVVHAALAAWLWRRAREALDAGEEGPFALSRAELQRDREGLGGRPP